MIAENGQHGKHPWIWRNREKLKYLTNCYSFTHFSPIYHCISWFKSALIRKNNKNNIKTGGVGVAGRPVGAGGDGDGLVETGIPIIGAKPGTLDYVTNWKKIMQGKMFISNSAAI